MVKIIAWVKMAFTKLHTFIVNTFTAWHQYAKIGGGLFLKVAGILLLCDILLRTKFGILKAIIDILDILAKVSVGGAITIAVVSIVIVFGILRIEKKI